MLSINKLFKPIQEVDIDDHLTPQQKQLAFQLGKQAQLNGQERVQQKQQAEQEYFDKLRDEELQLKAQQDAQIELDKQKEELYKNQNLNQDEQYVKLKNIKKQNEKVEDELEKSEKLDLEKDPEISQIKADNKLSEKIKDEKYKQQELQTLKDNPELRDLRLKNKVDEDFLKKEENAIKNYELTKKEKELDDIKTKTEIEKELQKEKREREVEDKLEKVLPNKKEGD